MMDFRQMAAHLCRSDDESPQEMEGFRSENIRSPKSFFFPSVLCTRYGLTFTGWRGAKHPDLNFYPLPKNGLIRTEIPSER